MLDAYQKELQRNIDVRKQLAEAILDNYRMNRDNSSTVSPEIQTAAESKITDLRIKNKANVDLMFHQSRKLNLLSEKLSLWDKAFI